MKRVFIGCDSRKITDHMYECDGEIVTVAEDEIKDSIKAEGYTLYTIDKGEELVYKLMVKFTDKCLFYEIKKEIKGEIKVGFLNLKTSQMDEKEFYNKDFKTFEVYESEEEEFFVLSTETEKFIPRTRTDLNINYLKLTEENLSEYKLIYKSNINGKLAGLNIDEEVLKNKTITIIGRNLSLSFTKQNTQKLYTKQNSNITEIYVKDFNNEEYFITQNLNEYKMFVSVSRDIPENLKGFCKVVDKKIRKTNKEGISSTVKEGGAFGWLSY